MGAFIKFMNDFHWCDICIEAYLTDNLALMLMHNSDLLNMKWSPRGDHFGYWTL